MAYTQENATLCNNYQSQHTSVSLLGFYLFVSLFCWWFSVLFCMGFFFGGGVLVCFSLFLFSLRKKKMKKNKLSPFPSQSYLKNYCVHIYHYSKLYIQFRIHAFASLKKGTYQLLLQASQSNTPII